jgi:hypothetical protein
MIVERAAVYEQDRLDPLQPSEPFNSMMRTADLARFPAAYRHMAFRVLVAGRTLASPIHHDGAPETKALYARYDAWLSGQ